MRFVVTGGGTAGHINPALAVAQELRTLGHEVVFAGTPQGLESRLIPQEGFAYTGFAAAGFNRKKPLTFFTSSAKILASTVKAARWLMDLKPHAVVGFGGYVSISVGLAASLLKIPLAIHEQNSRAGLANRFLAKRAQLIALTYALAADDFKASTQPIITGNPVRAALFGSDRTEAREFFGLLQDAVVLLVFGGSLGALHLNTALVANAEELLAQTGLQILHITGTRDYEEVRSKIAAIPAASGRWQVVEYCDRMGEAYAAADAVLSRAGATTLAEIVALGKPALLVPYPFAAADEQSSNAKSLVDAGAADLLLDSELDEPVFIGKLMRLVTDEAYREGMRTIAATLGKVQSRQELARLIIKLAAGEC